MPNAICQNAMPLWTLTVHFSNGFNDLVSAFVHRIWGSYNSTTGRSLIGPERVLHDYWACILNLGGKKKQQNSSGLFIEMKPSLILLPSTWWLWAIRWVATVKKVIWLCVPQRRQRQRICEGGIGVALGHWPGWERELCGLMPRDATF